jgi:4-oxalocrotonate tautomerase
MPLVTVRALEGALSPAQREELLLRITETIVAVQGEGVRPVTWVIFDEIRDRSIAVGGDVISTSYVRRLMETPAASGGPGQP